MTAYPAPAYTWNSSKNLLPYWVNGPPWMLNRTGYFAPVAKPAGRTIQASTSEPSGETAVNRSEAGRMRSLENDPPASVSLRSPAYSSDSIVGVVDEWTIRPAAASAPVTHWS